MSVNVRYIFSYLSTNRNADNIPIKATWGCIYENMRMTWLAVDTHCLQLTHYGIAGIKIDNVCDKSIRVQSKYDWSPIILGHQMWYTGTIIPISTIYLHIHTNLTLRSHSFLLWTWEDQASLREIPPIPCLLQFTCWPMPWPITPAGWGQRSLSTGRC